MEDKINPWLEEKLKGKSPNPGLRILVETEPNKVQEVLSEIKRAVPAAKFISTSWGRYISVEVPEVADIDTIAKIPGVKTVHYDAPVWVKAELPAPKLVDPLLGEISVSKVEIPGIPPISTLALNPLGTLSNITLGQIFSLLPLIKEQAQIGEYIVYTVASTRRMIGAPAPPDNTVKIKVAALDTGAPFLHPQMPLIDMRSVTGEPPADSQGHGSWVTTCAFGGVGNSPIYGTCAGVSRALNAMHVRCLSTLGFGATSWVLSAMEIAYNAGAKIMNLSLGGPLQGRVEDDPLCRIIEETWKDVLWIIASGNDGPDKWTIGSPAAAPHAITVASWSPHYKDVSVFSSRGPQGEWYSTHKSDFNEDLEKYGEIFLKPTLMAPGGGPVKSGQRTDLIASGLQGWADGIYSRVPHGYEGFRGTSMATPHVAGLLAILYDRGFIKGFDDVINIMRFYQRERDDARGWGFIHFKKFTALYR